MVIFSHSNFSKGSRDLIYIEHNLIGPSRGHGDWGHCDAMGPILKIISSHGARSKNRLKIIITGHRDSLSYLIFSWFKFN